MKKEPNQNNSESCIVANKPIEKIPSQNIIAEKKVFQNENIQILGWNKEENQIIAEIQSSPDNLSQDQQIFCQKEQKPIKELLRKPKQNFNYSIGASYKNQDSQDNEEQVNQESPAGLKPLKNLIDVIQQQLPKSDEQPKIKYPLRCCQKFIFTKRTYKPNISEIQTIDFEATEKKYLFLEDDILQIADYDLTQITGIHLCQRHLIDKRLDMLVKLKWQNIISLSLINNKIKDITPIKNLNLQCLKILKISGNRLGKQSANFLSQYQFPSLIYYQLSFFIPNKLSWQIFLRNELKNYPKLQFITICGTQTLTQKIIKKIIRCVKKFTKHQKSLSQFINEEKSVSDILVSKYPQNYSVTIYWWNRNVQNLQRAWKDYISTLNLKQQKLETLSRQSINNITQQQQKLKMSQKNLLKKTKKIQKDNHLKNH